MDSEKHPDFFFFLVGVGSGMEGVGTGGDSPEGKTALSSPTAFPGQPGSKPLDHISLCRCKCLLWLQTELVSPRQGEDGNLEQEQQRATKNLTLFPSTWYRIERPGPIWRGGGDSLTGQVNEEAALSSARAAGPNVGEAGGRQSEEETNPGSNFFSFPGS